VKPKDVKNSYAGATAAAAARKKAVPAGEVVIYDFATRKESYHYQNEGSDFGSEPVHDGGRPLCRITYKHHGAMAWVGAGLWFGSLDTSGYSAFRLTVRAKKACRLEVKAYPSDEAPYAGAFSVETQWRELTIPFRSLHGPGGSFDAAHKLRKLELQPSPDHDGGSLDLAELRLVR
jgi:hypothetical protein